MDTLRPLKSQEDYEAALVTVETLIDASPATDSVEGDRLEILTLLIRDYESKAFPLGSTDPIEAIRFRMDQQGLLPRDLIPYLGSRSKVSEILSGKRELTLSMIRALHLGLGIPAEALITKGDDQLFDTPEKVEWARFPLREMVARGWIKATATDIRERAEELVREFLAPVGGVSALAPALYRKADHVRSARTMDLHALSAWTARVLMRAGDEPMVTSYRPGTVDSEFLRDFAQLSRSENAPVLARHALAEIGIILVIEPHLPRTHLDGAAMRISSGAPVIALTLRFDRLDNFWFTLFHELAHVALHLDVGTNRFYDDLETDSGTDTYESEADALAGEALIPTATWLRSAARVLPTPDAAEELADQLGVHPAIVAGRIQHERGNYKLLHQLVGRNEVRSCFPGILWD